MIKLDIKVIRQLVEQKRYQLKLHALQHALKEGFSEKQIVEAILSGQIIESYPDEQRALVCGQTLLDETVSIYLHVVCEQNYPDQVEFVTAYIPDERVWEKPPFKRRKKR
jgi:hypothetical protein